MKLQNVYSFKQLLLTGYNDLINNKNEKSVSFETSIQCNINVALLDLEVIWSCIKNIFDCKFKCP